MHNAAIATPHTVPESQLSHFYRLPAPPIFGAYELYMQGLISRRALCANFALMDIHQRRRIGGHRLSCINPHELARFLDSDDYKRNDEAIRQLVKMGFWHETDMGYQPAQSLDHLRIDVTDLQTLQTWMDAKDLNRRCLVIPRLMFEEFPHLEKGQLALNLELLCRCKWEGGRSETTAIRPLSLKVGDIAERWGLSTRTVQDVLHRQGLGANVHLEADDSPGWHRQKYGCRYRVIIRKRAGSSMPTPVAPTPEPIRLTVAPKTANSDAGPAHQIAPPEPEPVHQITPLLILFLILSFQRDFNPSNPPDAAEDPGVHQAGEKSENENGAETGHDTIHAVPTPSTAVDTEVNPHPVPDAEVATTMISGTGDSKTSISPPTPASLDSSTPVSQTPTSGVPADIKVRQTTLPSVKTESGEALPAPDWNNLIDADLRDMTRLHVLYEQVVKCGILRPSQKARLNFVAAAVHSRFGRNPCGLLRNTVEHGQWERITDREEDIAQGMIKQYEQQSFAPHLHLVPKASGLLPTLSGDARLVASFYQFLIDIRYQGDVFYAFKGTAEGCIWTRDRWESACDQANIRRVNK